MQEEKILIIGPAWVGDMVMAQALFKLLKQQAPNTLIDVAAPDWTRALLLRMPEVNQAISLPLRHGEFNLYKRFKLGRSLRNTHYSQAIVLPNSWKSALIPFFAGIKKRTGWQGEARYGLLNDRRTLPKDTLRLMVERFMALGLEKNAPLPTPYAVPKLTIDNTSLKTSVDRYHLDITKPIVALCPGAEFGPSKRWPAAYFAEVAKAQLAAGCQVWLFGSQNDVDATEEIQTLTHNACVNLAGKTSLADAIDLLSLAKVVVSNDSGLMHIAAALHKPLVAVYGSTSPKFTPPLGKKVKVLQLPLACSPCFKRECPLQHWRCMRDLKPALVIDAIHQMVL
jgi:heptosyltransferase II